MIGVVVGSDAEQPAGQPSREGALLAEAGDGGLGLWDLCDVRGGGDGRYSAVNTYIQSGNVLFESDAPNDSLENKLEAMLERRLGFPLVVVVRSHRQLRHIVDKAPNGFGEAPDTYHSDVIFLKGKMSGRQAMRVVELREEVDQAWTGSGVLYFARVGARLAQSRMSRIVGTREYQHMTIRSWTTTTELLGLLDARRVG